MSGQLWKPLDLAKKKKKKETSEDSLGGGKARACSIKACDQ